MSDLALPRERACDEEGARMDYEIVVEDVVARPIAAVHASVAVGQVDAAWCHFNHRSPSSVSWEIYGDPGDDPASLEIRVFYLLG